MDRNTNSSSSKDEYLKHLNKISYKISKQSLNNSNNNNNNRNSLLPPPPPPPSSSSQPPSSSSQFQNLPNQPPVYNINKSDFRDVVQRLTGSPAHERFVSPPLQPPPSTAVKQQQSSRLHRIRPPPLAHLVNRPPPSLLNNATASAIQHHQQHQQLQQPPPISPLPALPSVHTAAESPVSAYMRYLHGTISSFDSDPKRFPGFSPRWSNSSLSPSSSAAPGGSLPQFPLSPLSFGCSPMLSPTGNGGGQLGFPQFPPLSPKLPAASP